MSRPAEVYAAVNRVSAALSTHGVAKGSFNLEGAYFYRSIDEVVAAVAPLMAAERLSLLPRRQQVDLQAVAGPRNSVLTRATLKATFDLVCADDASSHRLRVVAEALDDSDKATAKAVSSAYKHALLQLFCIPVPSLPDPDRSRLRPFEAGPAPDGGWEAWAEGFRGRLGRCRCAADIASLEAEQGAKLASLMRFDAGLYRQLGSELAAHEASLAVKAAPSSLPTPRSKRRRSKAPDEAKA